MGSRPGSCPTRPERPVDVGWPCERCGIKAVVEIERPKTAARVSRVTCLSRCGIAHSYGRRLEPYNPIYQLSHPRSNEVRRAPDPRGTSTRARHSGPKRPNSSIIMLPHPAACLATLMSRRTFVKSRLLVGEQHYSRACLSNENDNRCPRPRGTSVPPRNPEADAGAPEPTSTKTLARVNNLAYRLRTRMRRSL